MVSCMPVVTIAWSFCAVAVPDVCTNTVTLSLAIQPLSLVTSTLYPVVTIGKTC